tara:strand:+ start:8834 stop:9736 length:903 start_codon:yes stop_codon:yes gene_type:complete
MVPLLVLFNLIFLTYWLLKRKRQLWLSAFVLLLGYISLGNFFKFKLSEEEIKEGDLSIMSYNVKGFNKFDWLHDASVEGRIMEFISSEDPDILCIQEFSRIKDRQLKKLYPFKFITGYKSSEKKSIQAIYSKFPIINSGSLDFPDSGNNAIFADIVVSKDTIRLYNLHLESHRVIPSVRRISNEPKGRLLRRLAKSFAKQGEQAELFDKHRNATTYRKIVCGDFNNTQFSNVYKLIKGEMNDSFMEKGTGYGRTFNFKYYPVRIDFILADQQFEIMAHKNFDIKLSDHFPVMASIKIDSK